MDHIPLEIHMGLEIKGELPDKMLCTLLSTKCLNNRLNFLPNPEGHGFFLWVFSTNTVGLEALWLSALLPVKDNSCHCCSCPPFFIMHMRVQFLKRIQFQEGRRKTVWDAAGFLFSSSFFSVFLFFP